MIDTPTQRGMAFVCDRMGVLTEIIEDRIGVLPEETVGQPLLVALHEGSLDKAMRMVEQLRRDGALFDWELDFESPISGVETVRIAAAAVNERFVFAATMVDGDLELLLDELSARSSEYVDALRSIIRPETRPRSLSEGLAILSEVNSEMANLQRELAQKNSALSRTLKEKNELLGMVAHDLRGPLHAILLSCHALANDSQQLSGLGAMSLESVEKSAHLMKRLCDDALDLASVEAGKLRLCRERADLAELTETVVEIFRGAAEERSTAVHLDVSERPLVAYVDVSKYEQVVSNLLGNALKHCPLRSKVEVGLRRIGDRAVLEVRDDGPGLSAERRQTLFRPFEGSRGTDAGAGLGLAIAQKMVQGHGGHLEVDSELGRGSVFRVSLPLGDPAQERVDS